MKFFCIKLCVAFPVLIFCSFCFAANVESGVSAAAMLSPSFSGFFVGAYVGKQVANTKIDNQLNVVVPGIVNVQLPVLSDADDSSPLGGVSLGYALVFNHRYFLGAEGRVGFERIRASAGLNIASPDNLTRFNSDTELCLNNNYIFDIKPGILLSKSTLLYGLLGISMAHVTIRTEAAYFQNVGFGLHSGNIDATQTRDPLAPVFGLGVEQFFTRHFSAKLEYDFIDYGSLITSQTMSAPVSGVTPNSQIIMVNNIIAMKMNKIILGLSYHFA